MVFGLCQCSQSRFFAIVHGEPLEHQATKTRTSSSTDSVIDPEPLQASAIVSQLTDPIKYEVYNLLHDGVMTARENVGCILLARD